MPPSDWRVSEVRLIESAGSYGDQRSTRRAANNLLIEGDALNALTSLSSIPEFAREYAGNVKLCYIDPPFNTQQSFLQYDDALEHSVWLTMMRDRLLQVRKLLSLDGSVWVHCDDSEQHRLRSVMDEIFTASNYQTTIVWQKLYARKSNTNFSGSHDYILVYSQHPTAFKRNLLPPSEEQLARYTNRDNDPRGRWQSVSFSVRTDDPERRTEYRYNIKLPSGRKVGPPNGRHWNGKQPRYRSLLKNNLLWFGEDGDSRPREKLFLDLDTVGLVPTTWWARDEVGDNDESKSEIQSLFPDESDVFQTPKPERLMQRIVHIATRPGDIVLDCFVGSGSTAAVAHKMKRRWVAVERSTTTINDWALPRLEKVVLGHDEGGISQAEGWKGGGGFQSLRIAPSMFEEEKGVVYLADWATNGSLSEATAAQLGFEYKVEPPFSGCKGRSRLAVIDGLVNEAVIRAVVSSLGPTDRTVICGTAIDPDCRQVLKELRPGSTLRKIPASILQEYRARATTDASS